MSLRQVLAHATAFEGESFSTDAARYVQYLRLPHTFSENIVAPNPPPLFYPGEPRECGMGANALGRIIEEVSGTDVETYFRDHIFTPLEMNDTGFMPTDLNRLSSVHARASDGLPHEIDFSHRRASNFPLGGGLYSTACDFLVFLQMLLQEGRFKGVQLLRPKTVEFIRTSQIGTAVIPKFVNPANAAYSQDIDLTSMFPHQNLARIPGTLKPGHCHP